MSQNLQKLAFFNEHVQIFDGNILWYIRPRFFKNAANTMSIILPNNKPS